MLIFIDNLNKYIFIASPKCGNTSMSHYLNVDLHIKYYNIEDKLNDNNYLKIIVVRDIYERFISGFNEDLNNNDCYEDLNINFDQYLDFLKFCNDNKIKNCNNLNSYFKDLNVEIWWGQCSNKKLNITDSNGLILGHISSQKYNLENIINKIKDNNVKIIDIKDLSNYIGNIKKNNKSDINNNYDNNTKLSEIKKNRAFFVKSKLLTKRNINIIKHIYYEDIEFIENLNIKYNNNNNNNNSIL